ncbi:MAG: hypothetical protein V4577_11130 [Bacteroidota bacterium]
MKVLVIGPSGSGKSYLADALQAKGINAFDDEDIDGLSSWYNQRWQKIPPPKTADEAFSNHYSFLWDKKFLADFLDGHDEVYIFGGSGNVMDVFDLFDKVYFLKISLELQKERLRSPLRKTPALDFGEEGQIIWGAWFEDEARKRNVPFVDADQTPEEIFEIISRRNS